MFASWDGFQEHSWKVVILLVIMITNPSLSLKDLHSSSSVFLGRFARLPDNVIDAFIITATNCFQSRAACLMGMAVEYVIAIWDSGDEY